MHMSHILIMMYHLLSYLLDSFGIGYLCFFPTKQLWWYRSDQKTSLAMELPNNSREVGRVATNSYSTSLTVGISTPRKNPFQTAKTAKTAAFFQTHTTRSTRLKCLMVLEDTRGSTETPQVEVLQASKNFRITQGSPRGNTCTWPRLPNAHGFR